ncbi:hypothetical protein FRC08_006909 [Ceratobasidium sp. 394]|nr:hypothetical protein FRC08_006909 [Ceratobasidium sp. 394]KAG9082066.1 hypothetical protein FS749_007134 [Ceratobasidium sp. UAMH 11750]
MVANLGFADGELTVPPKKEPKEHPKETTFMNQTTITGTLIPKEAWTKKPEPFSGKKGKEAEAFLMKMEIYDGDYDEGTFSDGRKTTALLMNMAPGEAADWAQPLLKKVSKKDTKGLLKSWNTLKAAFLLHFQDPVKKEKAIQELAKLSQTKSAQAYATRLRILMQEVDWNQEALIDKFKEGLKPEVQKELSRPILIRVSWLKEWSFCLYWLCEALMSFAMLKSCLYSYILMMCTSRCG